MKELLHSLSPGDRDWQLANELDPARIPSHIAIIMDGNGRWAKRRNFPRLIGHKAGMDTVSRIVEACTLLGLEALTLYAFSVENWKRPRHEVEGLWRLLRYYLRREMPRLMQNEIQLVVIGRIDALPPEVQRELLAGMEKTAKNRRMRLNLAINYGGRTEIVDAVNKVIDEARRNGHLESLEVTEEMVSQRLYTADVRDPDLLIRTSGEMRISNFLLWQIAYAELYVTETLWPDFNLTELLEAVLEYQNRERRFGGLSVNALPSVDSASYPLEQEAIELPFA